MSPCRSPAWRPLTRSNACNWKSCVRLITDREFESPSLRHENHLKRWFFCYKKQVRKIMFLYIPYFYGIEVRTRATRAAQQPRPRQAGGRGCCFAGAGPVRPCRAGQLRRKEETGRLPSRIRSAHGRVRRSAPFVALGLFFRFALFYSVPPSRNKRKPKKSCLF